MMSSTIPWHNQAFLQFLCYWGFSTSEDLYQKLPNKIRQRQWHSPSSPRIFLGGIYFQQYCCYAVIEISSPSCRLWPASLSVQTLPATTFQFGCYATSPGRHFYCVCAFPCIDDLSNVFLFSYNLNLMLLVFSAVTLNLESDKPLQDTALIFYFLSDWFSRKCLSLNISLGLFPFLLKFVMIFTVNQSRCLNFTYYCGTTIFSEHQNSCVYKSEAIVWLSL